MSLKGHFSYSKLYNKYVIIQRGKEYKLLKSNAKIAIPVLTPLTA